MQIWEYLRRKQQKRLVFDTPRKQHCFKIVVLQLGFNYLFVEIYKELLEPPYHHYFAVFGIESSIYVRSKFLTLERWSMSLKLMLTRLHWNTKRRRIKLMEKLLIVLIFLGYTPSSIWALDTQEEAWAKKVGLTSLKKFN